MNTNRIQVEVAAGNHKSGQIPEKQGFRFGWTKRDGELLVDNVFTGIAIYGLLKRKFKG
ncbi:MAG: hypothetical protein LBR26_03125 [Prevotella sp.]|jgi:ribosomal-protein-serine acetyltransferase|nr:hypothetical protein [Prevotella sp.]